MDDWVSQAEAARIRGVSRQAISKLVKKGRLRTLEVAGYTLVHRKDLVHFEATNPGRPKKGEMNTVDKIKELLLKCSPSQKEEIFHYLRSENLIHPLEKKLNTKAEIILEAIARAGDLTLRGVRGIIVEAAFKHDIVNNLRGWEDITPKEDHAYDFLLKDSVGMIKIQVKMQRQKEQRPMMANEGYKFLSKDMFVVETQRTRGGKDPKTGEDTRPYRFGEFDILAVSMQPSTNLWNDFMYTIADWAIPRKENPEQILKFQPVAKQTNEDWTNSIEEAIKWLRSGKKKTICSNEKHNN